MKRAALACLLALVAGGCRSAEQRGENAREDLTRQPPLQENGENVPEEPFEVPMEVYSFRPPGREPTPELLRQLQLPAGFEIEIVASGLGKVRMMEVHESGTLFLTHPEGDRLLALRDTNGDGRYDDQQVVLAGIKDLHGVTIHQGRLYVASNREVWEAALAPNGDLLEARPLVQDMITGGQHPNRTLRFGPDGMLYVSVGSTCNACDEPNPEAATLLQFEPDTWSRRVYAEGLRNTIGFDWHPTTGVLWGMDHGTDMRGDDVPPEELNRIEEGRHYGWPWVYGDRVPDLVVGEHEEGFAEFAGRTEPPVLEYTAHAAPMDMRFYTGDQFPMPWRNQAFVTFRGSWNRSQPSGYRIDVIRFDEQGRPTEFEPFVTGFLIEDGTAQFARLVGLAVDRDGSLLVSEDEHGTVFRIRYVGLGEQADPPR